MKRFFLSTLFLAGSLFIMADDYQYLTVINSGSEKDIELASIQKITFEVAAGNVVVSTTEGEVRLPINEMEKMYFSTTPTAIEKLPLQTDALQIQLGRLLVKGEGLLRIYSTNGALQRMAKVEGDTTVSLSNLPQGTYIISLGKQTIKVTK